MVLDDDGKKEHTGNWKRNTEGVGGYKAGWPTGYLEVLSAAIWVSVMEGDPSEVDRIIYWAKEYDKTGSKE